MKYRQVIWKTRFKRLLPAQIVCKPGVGEIGNSEEGCDKDNENKFTSLGLIYRKKILSLRLFEYIALQYFSQQTNI